MNPDEFVTITRGLVRRGWSEIEPKVAASFVTGGVSGIFLAILTSYHVPVTPALAQWAPYLFAILGGYIFPSSGQVIVTKADERSKTTTTKTVGAVQTIVTGPIPIQEPAPKKYDDFLANLPSSSPLAPVPEPATDQQTQVMYKP